MLLERFIILLVASFTAAQTPKNSLVVVNCTWPCANSSDVCILTNDNIRCNLSEPHQWVMTVLDHSPTYSGKPRQLSEACQTAPMPDPQHFNATLAINTTISSTIQWPPTEDPYHPLDQYLGNCLAKGYCSPFDNTCHPKLEDGQLCNSTNQCLESQCVDGHCNAGWKLWSSSEEAQQISSGFNAIHVIAGVVGIIVLIIIATVSILVFRRRRRTQSQKRESTLPISSTYSPWPGTGLGTQYTSNPRHMSFATFANNFNPATSDSTTEAEPSRTEITDGSHIHSARASVHTVSPAMQQLQLQLRLQQELRIQEMQQVQQPMAYGPGSRPKEMPPPPYQP